MNFRAILTNLKGDMTNGTHL